MSSGGSRFLLSAGPQLMLGRGAKRVTAHAAAGVVLASTVMSLDGLGTDDRYTRRNRYTDLAPVLQTGAGLSLRLARTSPSTARWRMPSSDPRATGSTDTFGSGASPGPTGNRASAGRKS
ncbi:MAG: hypothetical protein ACREXU_11650 [Gammaproteobacteria bacterium]